MRTQKGFIYPFTVMIALFLLTTVFSYVTLLGRELDFYREKEEYVKLENILHLATHDVLNNLQQSSDLNYNYNNSLAYPHGSAYYRYQRITDTKTRVDLYAKTDTRTMTVRFEYDHETHKVIKWIELN